MIDWHELTATEPITYSLRCLVQFHGFYLVVLSVGSADSMRQYPCRVRASNHHLYTPQRMRMRQPMPLFSFTSSNCIMWNSVTDKNSDAPNKPKTLDSQSASMSWCGLRFWRFLSVATKENSARTVQRT